MVRLRHFGIIGKDWKKVEKFYCKILGLKVLKKGRVLSSKLGFLGGKYRYLKYVKMVDGVNEINSIEFYMFEKEPNTYIDICHHFAFTVDNLDELYKTLINNHVRCFSQPISAPDNKNIRLMFCEDYEGNLIELVEDKNEPIYRTPIGTP